MIHLQGDFYFDSDGARNLTLYKKGVVTGEGNGKKASKENIGKARYEILGHYSTLERLVDGYIRRACLEAAADSSVKNLGALVERIDALVNSLSIQIGFHGVDGQVTASRMGKA